ncbi:MAG: DUF1015 domain-containing protein [Planctomycetes bacterium]|nr:DUF1015 domain-containing protein [Planctomycetota bacterium]
MARIARFQALRYNPRQISFISRVVAPPYDIIPPEQARTLAARDEHNVIRLILGKEGDSPRQGQDYENAAAALQAWRKSGVLIQDETPSLYLCEEVFSIAGAEITRRGLFCDLLLEDLSGGNVLPHEQTTPGPKADRLKLLEACKVNLSPVLCVFSDEDGGLYEFLQGLEPGEPLYEFASDEHIVYKMWRIADEPALKRLGALLDGESLLIADGHHRYDTALAYRDRHRNNAREPGAAPEDYALIYGISSRDPGLKILPTHRLVKGGDTFSQEGLLSRLAESFDVTEVPVNTSRSLVEFVENWSPEDRLIGYYPPGGTLYLLDLENHRAPESSLADVPGCMRDLAVSVLLHGILKPLFDIPPDSPVSSGRVRYEADSEEVYWAVESGQSDVSFLLPPVSAHTVSEVAQSGHTMPPKTTYFYPKALSGLVFNPLDDDARLPRPLSHSE